MTTAADQAIGVELAAPMAELVRIARAPTRTIVGLMSGTSLDGIDAALVDVSGSGRDTRVALRAFETFPFPDGVRERVLDTLRGSVRDVCEVNRQLGDVFAEAALRLAREAGVPLSAIDLVASHGQTVWHVDRSTGAPSTLQIGDGSVIAARTGKLVVCDFRTADIAAGGAGAPLVAYVDHALVARDGEAVLLQNIGGMANVTVVTPDPADVVAFDTGPGNVLIDEACRALTMDEDAFDEDGALSALGEVDEGLLARLMAHEFLRLPPPKTTGRELFGADFARGLIEAYDQARLMDLVTTLVHFTARSIGQAIREHVLPRVAAPVRELVLSGGGVHNKTLWRALEADVAQDGIALRRFDDLGLGFGADAKEAVAFAILANETVQGRPSNLPAATGARRPAVLGKLVLGGGGAC